MITTYSYDAAGNRTRLNVDGALTTYAYDAGNRLRRSQELAGITTFTFDNNGNQRSLRTPTGDITTYSWTYENQLKRVEDAEGALTTYTWAPVNRNGVELRISRETEDVFTNFLWDDQRLLMETDEVGAVEAEYTLQPLAHGTVWTKAMPDGNTAVVRIDPAMVRARPRGFADEVPHIHKEIVPSNKVTIGNYDPADATRLNDACIPSTDPRELHIPGEHSEQ